MKSMYVSIKVMFYVFIHGVQFGKIPINVLVIKLFNYWMFTNNKFGI